MEIPKISIPEIKINVPQYNPYQVLNVPPPSIKLPGCVKYHRDASPKNTALYDDDPTGTTISCPTGSMPTFKPLLYDRRKIEIIENKEQEKRVENTEAPAQKEVKPKIPKEKEEIKLEPCPAKNNLRIGSFVNEKKLERIKDYIREDNGDCTTIYEKVDFKDQYIPEFSTVVSTIFIATVAATTPVIIQLIKPLIKQVVTKLTKKKDKSNP
ncbi:hypothetical protein MedDCM-OCT-S13-C2-cds13 [uncultured Mediterranean phage MEDS1 group]|nr:hypothetical protein MedDCM-OCT-S13-C2-cds13 [uncultured Mediterranean phage MEDS1 group]BAR21217.1 hypothetical protein [uncultured Mediterranean phage uvMED]